MDQNLPSMLTLSLDEETNRKPPGAPLLSRQEEDLNDYSSPPQSSSKSKQANQPDASPVAKEELDPPVRITPTDSMKNSLINIMAPVVYEMDDRILAVKESQLQLQSLIKRLLEELNSYVDLAHPPKLQDSINKLVSARRRLNTINATLVNVQERFLIRNSFETLFLP
ncbi:hypothetical protein DSO57_1027345 [Entomophthora muscae]|uniref:Uncharacterized protein n=1 Tax=Entomophthora muscae TaxID=34485 RepID=A0ACC2TZP3_9FUNG|nr:hypothetical protein DSO57_1027345 [Entomophthora muscae]